MSSQRNVNEQQGKANFNATSTCVMGNVCERAVGGRHVFAVGVLDDKEQVAGTGDLVVTQDLLKLNRHDRVRIGWRLLASPGLPPS